MTTLSPVYKLPALVADGKLKVLVVSDIHLGLEYELWTGGASIPSQTNVLKERLLSCINEVGPDRLVILGDLKHNVPRTSWQEIHEVPSFLRSLRRVVSVDIVPGNHDSSISNLIMSDPKRTFVKASSNQTRPETRGDIIAKGASLHSITLHPSTGMILDDVGYFHGHTWPNADILKAQTLVVAHVHPTIRLIDPLGYSSNVPVWVMADTLETTIKDRYGTKGKTPSMVFVPAFNPLCGGYPLNGRDVSDKGPLLKMADLPSARIYMLDGTDLGTLGAIRSIRSITHREY